MDKLKMHTPDFTQDNIAKLATLFPNCVTEARDSQGKVKKAVDFDQLRQELSSSIVEGPQERYRLDWPGKREALLAANAPIAKTLRPCREESVDFDTTKNLFIEGDNLEALKLLQETYLGKVKMIYIDPPYNTGNDFIYDDDFSINTSDYLEHSNQIDEIGNRLVANQEAKGRFHSDWLTMIYPRIKMARSLLSEDGIIMVSIDDHEFSALQLMLNEVYGIENFLCTFVWKRKAGGGDDSEHAATEHEYILVYARNKKSATFASITHESPSMTAKYNRIENGRRYYLERLDKTSLTYSASMDFEIECPDGTKIKPPQPDPTNPTTIWRWSQTKVKESQNELTFEREKKTNLWRVYTKTWISLDGVTPRSLLVDKEFGRNRDGTQDLAELLGPKVFSNPKPVKLLKHLIAIGANSKNALVLDFFCGSGTTGQAVIETNAIDNYDRRYILIQIPAETGRLDFKKISEITAQRLRKSGEKIKSENSITSQASDIGFRLLRIDTSNMEPVYYTPDAVKQENLLAHIDNIRPGRTSEDLLFQVLLDWGVDLALPIARETLNGKEVFFVDETALAACFEGGIDEAFVKELAKRKTRRVVFRDAGFADDAVKINVGQIFKTLSPDTDIKVI